MQKETSIYLGEGIRLTIFGCGLMILGSLVRVPLYPVPFTLQTLALFIVALTQSPKQAFASVICYLALASAGLPVLGGKIDPLWMTSKCGGYLTSFPFAAYLIAHLKKKSVIAALFCGQLVIFTLGFIGLIPFVSAKTAFVHGVVVFIPSAICKAAAAFAFVKWRQR